MFNIQRTGTTWGARLKKAAAAALLVAGSGAAMAAPVSVNLCAAAGNTGATGLPANTVVYGYGSTCTAPTVPGGPTITVNVGDVVTVTLTNNLSVPTGLMFQGQALPFDATGAAAGGGTKTYIFTATQPGTYLYESAPIPGAEYQVAMGLYGALVVRPATANQAYDSAASAYDNEAVLVLSELDPVLNNSATPANFDMRKYAPKYFLINGKPYPNTETFQAVDSGTQLPTPYAAGSKVALRYLNAGTKHHSMGVLGLRQVFVAKDGNLLPQANHNVVAESIAPGQTADAIVTIPATLAGAAKFAVYDAGLSLYNNGSLNSFGGMLAFLSAGAGSTTSGPTVTTMTFTLPNSLVAQIDATNPRTVNAYQYWFGSGGGVTDVTVALPAASVNVTATAAPPTVNGTIYLRGKDDQGNWGPARTVNFAGDTAGPTSTVTSLTPNPATPTSTISLVASATDALSNVAAAEYRLNGGAGVAATLGTGGTTRAVTASISGLAAGSYTVEVRAQDAVGNWGAWTSAGTLVVNAAQPPVVSAVSAAPNPNNGSTPLSATQPFVRVSATGTAVGGSVVAAEGFIDSTAPAIGTRGFPFVAADGVWGGGTEVVYADIPLTTIGALTTGNHTITVRAKDASGAWSAVVTIPFVIDKIAPTTSGLALTPAVTNSSAVTINATVNDATSRIGAAEYFIDTAGAVGTGTPMTVTSPNATNSNVTTVISAATVGALTPGAHTVIVRGKDAAGNWSTTVAATLSVDRTPPTFSAVTLNPAAVVVGTASVALTATNAADTGGGTVAGGEYWINPPTAADPGQGAGTAFTGTGTTLNVASFTAGSYTVSVRLRDSVGNWGTVRTATLTVVPDAIFANGFDAGGRPWGWSSASTTTTARLNVTTTPVQGGTQALQAQGNNTNYVQFGTFTPASGTLDTRFYFNPNNNAGNGQDIFAGMNGNNTTYRVRYRRSGAQPQVQIQVGNNNNNAWVNITNNAYNRIETTWTAGGQLVLHVNGVQSQTLTASNTQINQFRLGSVTSGGNNTLMFFDSFSAKRSTTPLIGP